MLYLLDEVISIVSEKWLNKTSSEKNFPHFSTMESVEFYFRFAVLMMDFLSNFMLVGRIPAADGTQNLTGDPCKKLCLIKLRAQQTSKCPSYWEMQNMLMAGVMGVWTASVTLIGQLQKHVETAVLIGPSQKHVLPFLRRCLVSPTCPVCWPGFNSNSKPFNGFSVWAVWTMFGKQRQNPNILTSSWSFFDLIFGETFEELP